LIIHNTKGAAYGWEVIRNSWSGESFFLPDVGSGLFFQGWINGETAGNVLKAAGFDRNDLFTKAGQRDFEPVSLGLQVRVRQRPRFRTLESENIGAVLQGKHKDRRDRHVVLSAHYDHLGRDPSLDGDQIYNGAVDNCSASAALLALARYYSQRPEALKANLIFVAVTAEEKGLLGSDYFARHLPVSSSSVLANLNFEMTNVWGETEDVYAIGGKHSDLDEICREAAAKIGLKYIPERDTELGYFYRSDQLSFARGGIPAVWLHEGITSKSEDKDYVLRKVGEYRRYRYHQPSDQMEADWDLKGTVQVARWAREVISLLSESEVIPDFKDSSSFRRK
jgi:Zn-dependent M28 family amino/carboxypeptidase